MSKKELGEINDGLKFGCKPLNLDNWSIEVNDDVVEKVEQDVAQEAALRNWMKEWADLAKDCAKKQDAEYRDELQCRWTD